LISRRTAVAVPAGGDIAIRPVVAANGSSLARSRPGRTDHPVESFAARFGQTNLGTPDVTASKRRPTDDDPDPGTVEDVMEPGPGTVHPDSDLASLAERLGERNLRYAVVTTPDGKLVGIVRRSDAEARLKKT